MLYGETNSVDIRTKVDIGMINYWLKLVSEGVPKFSSIICSKFSKDMINSCSTELKENKDNVSYKWLKKIKQIIDDTGFSYVWLSNDQISSSFRSMFKQRRHDIFVQNWRNEMNSNSQCMVYKMFKQAPKIEKFMLNLDYVHKIRLSKYISRVHNLPVTNIRFNFKDNDSSTFCPLCNDINTVGVESHYLFACQHFGNVRKRFLPDVIYDKNDMPSSWKNVLNSDTPHLIGVSRFIKIILKKFNSKFSSKSNSNKNNFNFKSTQTRCGRKVKPPIRFDL